MSESAFICSCRSLLSSKKKKVIITKLVNNYCKFLCLNFERPHLNDNISGVYELMQGNSWCLSQFVVV